MDFITPTISEWAGNDLIVFEMPGVDPMLFDLSFYQAIMEGA
jgi:hypothetical protein